MEDLLGDCVGEADKACCVSVWKSVVAGRDGRNTIGLQDTANGRDMGSLLLSNDANVLVESSRESCGSEVRVGKVGASLSEGG